MAYFNQVLLPYMQGSFLPALLHTAWHTQMVTAASGSLQSHGACSAGEPSSGFRV